MKGTLDVVSFSTCMRQPDKHEVYNSLPFYAPCNKPAVNIVGWKGRSEPPIRMCEACTYHNVRNRSGEIVRPFKKEDAGAQTT